MSDFGLFEAELDASTAPERVRRQASTKLANAIDEVRDRYGDFLLTASGKDEFEDRWFYAKNDIRKTAETHVFPNTGTMRRIHDALKREFVACDCDHDDEKKDKDHNDSSDQGGGYTARRRTAEEFHGDLIPEDNFDGYLDSVDQGAPERVENADFGQGGDTGSDRGREARRVALEMYTDWAEGNGMKVAKLATLEHYADTGISDNTYHLLANYILASDEEGGCDTDTDGPAGPDKDSDGPAKSDKKDDSKSDSGDDDSDEGDSDESDDSDVPASDSGGDESSDDSGDEPADGGDSAPPDFGGADADAGGPEEGPPADDQGFAGPPEGPQGLDDASPDIAPDAGMGDESGDPAAAGGDMYPDAAGPGDQFAIPDAPPDLSPDEQGMIPADDQQGDQSIPPELIDDILGLPPGTIEQLVVQEISGGGAAPDDGSGAPPPPPPADDDPSARLARQLFAEFTGKDWHSKSPKDESADKPKTNWDDTNGGVTKGKNPITPKASRRRVAGEDDGSGDSGADSTQDPAAGGQITAPPQGATPAASPTQPGPDDGAALDQAAQAVTQLIDQKTQQYQQLIDPLQQAAQAIEMALAVEQGANPLDVTPPAGTVDVGPGAEQPAAAPNTGMPTAALQRHAFKIAVRHDLSQDGYHMLLSAMSNQHYRHVAEAIAPLRDPQEKMALASSLVDMFKADNVRFNPGAFLASAGIEPQQHMASSPRDRAGDGWKDSRDRGDAEHESQDTDPDNWEEREAARLGLVASRHPFAEGSRRTAGETPTPATGGNTMDVFEFPGQGKTPKFTDNNKLTDLPAMKGPKIGTSVVDKYQHYKEQQGKSGLPTGGETGVDGFFNSPSGKGYGSPSQTKVHEVEGLQPHKVANFFQPKVAGWRWDDHQNAYLTDGQKPFRCTTAGCDTDIPTPSQTMCRCGRLWYTYGIGDSNHVASNTGQLFLAREIPVRPDVIMANRQFTADEEFNNESGDGPYQDYAEDVEFFNDDELDTAPKAHAPGETDMDTTRSAGRRTATDYPDDHNVVTRNGEKFCSACDAMLWDPNVHHCPEKQASRRTADWTVYDDDDNAGYTEGPSGPPSTKVSPVRKDWAKVDGKGRYAPNTFK
jgi:hypothetical protein